MTAAPAAVAGATQADEDGGVPPLAFVVAGLVLLAGAAVAGAVLVARSRRTRGQRRPP